MGEKTIDQSAGREAIQSAGRELQSVQAPWCDCSRVITPAICAANTVWFGCYPAGKYVVCICGAGDWNHYTDYGTSTGDAPSDAWIVTMYGVSDLTVPSYSQHAMVVFAGSDVLYFGVDSKGVPASQPTVISIVAATQPGGYGFTTEALAVASAAGCKIAFNHSGGPIGIHMSDNSYDNNCGNGTACGAITCGSNPLPSFGLSGPGPIDYSLTAGTTCGKILSGRYNVAFTFTSLCSYTDATITLSTTEPTGQIRSPTSVTMDIVSGSNTVTLSFDLADEVDKAFTGRILFSGGTDVGGNTNVLDGLYLDYDLTPGFTQSLNQNAHRTDLCATYTQFVELTLTDTGGLPFIRESGAVDLTCTVTDQDGLLTGYIGLTNASVCYAPPLTANSGPYCAPGGAGDLKLVFKTTGTPAEITLVFAWKVGAVSLPPTTQHLTLSWV